MIEKYQPENTWPYLKELSPVIKMKVVCTTVIHHTLGEFTHGHIYEIDWSKKKIVYKTKVPKPKAYSVFVKLNSRGGNRGGWNV